MMPDTDTRPLLSFSDLRYLSQTSPIARACIQMRKNEVRFAEWDIGPVPEAANHAAMRDFGERRSDAIRFFKNPDRDYASLGSWLDAALEDVLVTDSLAIYLRRTVKPGGGLLGSSLSALELIDGATLAPVGKVTVQFTSEVRRALAADYVSWAQYPSEGREAGNYGRSELLYRPFAAPVIPGDPFTDPATWAHEPFGRSPLEKAIAYGDDGSIDLAATEAKLPEAFGIELMTLGITAPDQPPAYWQNEDLGRRLRAFLKSIFDGILHETCDAPDLEWVWGEGDDGR